MSKWEFERFTANRARGLGVPCLCTKTNPKTMSVSWHDGSMGVEFSALLDSSAMNAALLEIWQRYKPQCSRGARFSHGRVGGWMSGVPHDAGREAAAVIRRYYTEALAALPLHLISVEQLEALRAQRVAEGKMSRGSADSDVTAK